MNLLDIFIFDVKYIEGGTELNSKAQSDVLTKNKGATSIQPLNNIKSLNNSL